MQAELSAMSRKSGRTGTCLYEDIYAIWYRYLTGIGCMDGAVPAEEDIARIRNCFRGVAISWRTSPGGGIRFVPGGFGLPGDA